MNCFKSVLKIVVLIVIFTVPGYPGSLADLSGDYLLYSFDHNYIFGKGNVKLKLKDVVISGDRIDMDISGKKCRIISDVTIRIKKGTETRCDMAEVFIDPFSYRCFSFKKSINISGTVTDSLKFNTLPITTLYSSLIYFIGRRFTVKKNLAVFGKEVTAFVEGVQSLSFRSFRLNRGDKSREQAVSVNNLWYYNNTGILGDFSLKGEKRWKKSSFKTDNNIRLNYDIFNNSTDENSYGIDFRSKNSIVSLNKNRINLDLNYIKNNVTQTVLGYHFVNSKVFEGNLSLDMKKSELSKDELWIRSFVKFNMKKSGTLSLNYNYEKSRDYSGDVNYRNNFGKRLTVMLSTSFSGVRTEDGQFNKITHSTVSLNYSTKIFNLSGDYTLNSELLYKKSLSSPKFSLNFIPITFYSGLLSLKLSSTAVFNNLLIDGKSETDFRSNTVLSLSSKQIKISRSAGVEFSLRTEALVNNESAENYTSGGFLLKGIKRLFKNTDMEITYNYFTRRRMDNWFIEGTASSDITLLVKNNSLFGRDSFWASVSYDIDSGEYTSSYLHLEIALNKKWFLQTLVKYDFIFDNLTYNIYLERNAGRFKLRLSYRSLTKQLQLELIPD